MNRTTEEKMAVAHDFLSAVEQAQEVPSETVKALAEALREAIAGNATFSRALGLVTSQRGRPMSVSAHRDIADPWLPSRPEYSAASLLERFALIADGAIDQMADSSKKSVRARDERTVSQARILRFLINEPMVRRYLTLRFFIDANSDSGACRPLTLWIADQLRIGIANPRSFPTLFGITKTKRGRPKGCHSLHFDDTLLSDSDRWEIAREYLTLINNSNDAAARETIADKYAISESAARDIFDDELDSYYSEIYFSVKCLVETQTHEPNLKIAIEQVAREWDLSTAIVKRACRHVEMVIRDADPRARAKGR